MESALLSEDKEYYDYVNWYKEYVKDEVEMSHTYADTFDFVFQLFETFDTINLCSNRPSEINTLVDLIAQNTALGQIRRNSFTSTLDVFEETFMLILGVLDSVHLSRVVTPVPTLVVEEFSRSHGLCQIKMLPIFSEHFENSARVYNNQTLLDIHSVPFVFNGNTERLLVRVTNGSSYVYN